MKKRNCCVGKLPVLLPIKRCAALTLPLVLLLLSPGAVFLCNIIFYKNTINIITQVFHMQFKCTDYQFLQ